MTKVAVLGAGIWGKNLVRNFYNLNYLHTVCDMDEDNLKMVEQNYPDVKRTKDFNDILNNPNIDSVAVVTPSHTHFGLVKLALKAGKNVYVEKPISTVSQEAKDFLQKENHTCLGFGFSDHCPLPQDNIDNWPEIRMTIEESYDYIKKIRQEAKNYNFPVFAGFECEWSVRYKNFYKDFLLDELKVDYLAFGPHWVEHEGSFVYAPQFGDKKLLHIYTD